MNPRASIPSTLYATTIAKPVFGYDVQTENSTTPYQSQTVDMMTIDNLPNELPRDASNSFGEQFIGNVLEEYSDSSKSVMLEKGSVTKNGDLGSYFEYLRDYLNGK